jgi:hypothetical protein
MSGLNFHFYLKKKKRKSDSQLQIKSLGQLIQQTDI